MLKRLTMYTAVLAFAAGMMLTGARANAAKADSTGSWTGVITNDMCGAKDANATKGAQCTKDCVKKGAKLALYDTSNKEVYVLDPQEKATGHEGHTVTVKGTLDESTKTIHVTSLTMKSSKPAAAKSM